MTSKQPAPDSSRNFIADWALNILILLFGMTTLVQAYVVPTGSMEGNILIGDHMFVDKLAYSPSGPISKHLLPYTDVKRGDVIVFRYPLNLRETYVKRVIGVPGDRIKLVNKQVFLNEKAIFEPYKQHISNEIDLFRDNFPAFSSRFLNERARAMLRDHVENGELVVPPGMYFAMGDNRDNSEDSRYWGLVPRENIIGKPVVIFWSYDAPTEQLADPNIISLDHVLDLAQHFFTKTRWKRTLQLVRSYPIT